MVYKKNNNILKNDNPVTINLNDNLIELLDKLSSYYQRKPAELLRILITPVLINEYAHIMKVQHPENNTPMTKAHFKKDN